MDHLVIHRAELPEPAEPHELRDPFSRWIAMATVVTTFFAAVVGLLLAQTASHSERAALWGQRFAVESLGARLRGEALAQGTYEQYLLANKEGQRAAEAFQRKLFSEGRSDTLNRLDEARWRSVGKSERALLPSDSTIRGVDSPDNDISFPYHFRARAQAQSLRLGALRDQSNVLAAGWAHSKATYFGVLAIFAVVLYLFGQSLATVGRVRVGLAWVGMVLLVGATAWAGWTLAHPPHEVSHVAAKMYAKGVVVYNTADEWKDLTLARSSFEAATTANPEFAQAYVRLSDVAVTMGSTQSAGFTSIIEPGQLTQAIDDLNHAYDLGLRNTYVLSQLGFFDFTEAVTTKGHEELLGESISRTEEARRQQGEEQPNPVLDYNLGVALLASGRFADARAVYRIAVCHTLYEDDCSDRTARRDETLQEEWVSGALTDLTTLDRHMGNRPGIARQVVDMKEFIVGSVSRGGFGMGPASDTADFRSISLAPDGVSIAYHVSEYSAGDKIWIQWYHDPGTLGWGGVAQVSGPPDGTGNPDFSTSSYLVRSPVPQCLPAGHYSVEIYVNGRLSDQVGDNQENWKTTNLEAFRDRDLGTAVCRPASWTSASFSLRGAVAGYQDDAGHGLYILRLELPADYAKGQAKWLAGARFAGELVKDVLPIGHGMKFKSYEGSSFMDLRQAATVVYRYEDGEVRVGDGFDKDGSTLLIGLVYGPTDYLKDDAEGGQIFNSFSVYRGARELG